MHLFGKPTAASQHFQAHRAGTDQDEDSDGSWQDDPSDDALGSQSATVEPDGSQSSLDNEAEHWEAARDVGSS